MNKRNTQFIVFAAVIAAAYTALTYVSAAFGLAYGDIQFRISEALTVLPAFTPAAIPGLFVGCILGNLNSPYGAIDIICGSAATLIAAVMSYMLRRVRVKNIPVLSLIPPILVNGIVVGWEIAYTMPEGFAFAAFLTNGALVAMGQSVVVLLAGIPLCVYLNKHNFFDITK